MSRPAFQFYPADWRKDSALQRCSLAARGAWVELLCVLHEQPEYGVARFPLDELCQLAHVPLDVVHELVRRNVLKGCDSGAHPGLTHNPIHARKVWPAVTLLEPSDGPLWFSARFVKDEWKRKAQANHDHKFGGENDPRERAPTETPATAPTAAVGAEPSSSSSSSTSKPKSKSPRQAASPAPGRKATRTPLPPDFGISERVRKWAAEHNYGQLEQHLESFRLKCEKADYRYVNWDSAFMEAVRDDWAELRKASGGKPDEKPWYITQTGIIGKGREFGLIYDESQHFHEFRDTVYARAKVTRDMVQKAMREFMPTTGRKQQ